MNKLNHNKCGKLQNEKCYELATKHNNHDNQEDVNHEKWQQNTTNGQPSK